MFTFTLPNLFCRPFDVTPANGILAIQESMQVEIMFKPMTIGDHSEDLVISYDTGESMVWSWGKAWYLGTGIIWIMPGRNCK